VGIFLTTLLAARQCQQLLSPQCSFAHTDCVITSSSDKYGVFKPGLILLNGFFLILNNFYTLARYFPIVYLHILHVESTLSALALTKPSSMRSCNTEVTSHTLIWEVLLDWNVYRIEIGGGMNLQSNYISIRVANYI